MIICDFCEEQIFGKPMIRVEELDFCCRECYTAFMEEIRDKRKGKEEESDSEEKSEESEEESEEESD